MVQTSEPRFVQRQIDLRITFIGTCFHKGEGLHSGPAAIEKVTKTLDGAVWYYSSHGTKQLNGAQCHGESDTRRCASVSSRIIESG